MTYPRVPLGTVARIKHGWAFPGEGFTDDGERVLLTPGSFHERGGFKPRGEREKYYVGDFPPDFLLSPGDVLVCMTDLKQDAPLLGGSMRVPVEGAYLHNQRLGLVRVLDPDATDLAFLYYAFNLESFRAQVRASATGTTVRHTAPERMYRCEVPHPPRDVQRRIATTLAAFDDLIEVNERRIRLLEESIRVLYREWFERLRFPGYQRVAVEDGVPLGWTRAAFRQLVDEVRRAAPIEKIAPETPYVGLEHVPRRSLALADWGTAAEVTSGKLWFRRGEILFGKIRPYFHKVVVAPTDGVCSSDIIVFVPREGWTGLAAAVASSDAFVAHASKTSGEGARMPRANPRMLLDWPVLLPDAATASAFEEFVTPRIDQMNLLRAQSRAAARARDALLPRLMDGTLTPPDVAVVEAVG